MNVNILSQKIKTLEERVNRLEAWKAPKSSVEKSLDQHEADEEIRQISRAKAVLKRTSGIITKKKASNWIKAIDQTRSSWI